MCLYQLDDSVVSVHLNALPSNLCFLLHTAGLDKIFKHPAAVKVFPTGERTLNTMLIKDNAVLMKL
jgi:hypothetical protein